MADYGLIVKNASGNVIFSPATYAGRGINRVSPNVSGSLTDDILLQGIPWWTFYMAQFEFPRPCTVSITGNLLTYTLPTAGLTAKQIAARVVILYGVR